MILKLKYFFAVAIVVFSLTSCSKEYSDESGDFNAGNSAGNAIFTLNGAPDSCANIIVGGTYITGVSLNSSDTIILSVNVDSIGTYAITTGTVNGMSFNASGTFTYSGIQNVTLYGSGEPTVAGTSSFTAGANGCIFSIITGTNSNTGSGYYLTAGINGSNYTFDSSLVANSNNGTGLSSLLINGDDSGTAASFIITLNSKGAITKGTYTLSTASNPNGTFCVVSYVDNSNAIWATALSGQTGTFEVVVTNITSTSIQGTFNGTLYNASGAGSSSMTVTNGQFNVPIH